MASEKATPSPGVEIIVASSNNSIRENSVDVSNINLALDRASQNDFTVGKTEGRDYDTSTLEGTDLGGEAPQTPSHAGTGVGKSKLSIPGGARGSASVQVSNINLLVDTPSQNDFSRQKRNEDEMSTGTMEGREVGGEPSSPRIPVVRETEVSNINLALDTPSHGDYMAAQIREEREDTDVMIGKEVGGRSVTPEPGQAPGASAGQSRQAPGAQAGPNENAAGPAATNGDSRPAAGRGAENAQGGTVTESPNGATAKRVASNGSSQNKCCVIS